MTATGLGLRNLQRVMKMLPDVVPQDGNDDEVLERLYRGTWQQWAREMSHVVSLVGGYDVQNKHNDQPGAIAVPVPRDRQLQAVKFLADQGLAAPQWLLDPAVVQRLSASEQALTSGLSQRGLLRQLLAPSRTQRLMAQEAQLGTRAYRLEDLLADLRRSVFTELPGGAAIPAARRNLQRNYVDTLAGRLNGINLMGQDDGEAGVRAELVELKSVIAASAARGDRTRRAHLQALADTIAKALDPRFAPAANPAAALLRLLSYEAEEGAASQACWPGHEEPAWHGEPLQGLVRR